MLSPANFDSKMRHLAYQAVGAVLTKRHFLKRLWHATVVGWTLAWMGYSVFLTAVWGDPNTPVEFFSRGYKFKEYFFCIWMSIVQLIYFLMHSTIDYMEVYENNKTRLAKWTSYLHQAASFILFSLYFPCSLTILVFFWSVFIWDRENIYPENMETMFPMWLNHAMHTVPVPLALIYMIFSNKSEPSKLVSCSALVGFVSLYAYVFFAARFREGMWVYIMLDGLDVVSVSFLYAFICAFATLSLFIGHKLYSRVSEMRERAFTALSVAAAAATAS